MAERRELPVAVIGGGPIGLAAAAHLIDRNIAVRLYEAGDTVGASVRDWGHVRTFSPWRYNIDAASRKLLEASQWREPPLDIMPSGAEIYEHYLRPLAATPEIAAVVETGASVRGVTRDGMDKVTSRGRAERPFALAVRTSDGTTRRDLARAVIDASGTWTHPNPLGGNGLPAEGEAEHRDRIAYGIPDVLGRHRPNYAGRRVLVVGAGHSAANALLDLVTLAAEAPGTEVQCSTSSGYAVGADIDLPAHTVFPKEMPANADPAFAPFWGRWEGDDEIGTYIILQATSIRPKTIYFRIGFSDSPEIRPDATAVSRDVAFQLDGSRRRLYHKLSARHDLLAMTLKSATELEYEVQRSSVAPASIRRSSIRLRKRSD